MAARIKRIDISGLPDTLRLAEDVARTNQPHVLERRGKRIAVLSPIQRPTRPPRRPRAARGSGPNDWLLNLIGIADESQPSDGPTDVSANKHKYLADALLSKSPRTDPG